MPRFHLKQSSRHLTSHAGLALVGQCLEAAQLNLLDVRFPTSQGMRTSDIVKSYTGLLSLGKSDFEAIEEFRHQAFFKHALTLQKVPSSVWLRQRMERLAAAPADRIGLREEIAEYGVRMLQRTEAPITAHQGFVGLDFDTFVMDNSGTKKEWVSRTYQGVDGYTPIAAYLGNEGWCLGLELRPGSQHSALETHYFLERVLPRVRKLVPHDQAVLSRSDSGFDSARLLFQQEDEKRGWAMAGRRFEYLVKWNPRRQKMEDWIARADEAQAWIEERPGKRVALLDLPVERAWQKQKRNFRLIVRLIERTTDKRGQVLLLPDYQLEGWWTSLNESPKSVIERYCAHATHEQFHSEFKTDLDLERLPSGKFDCNDLILQLALLAYNSLRLIGQLGLTGELSPVRHPAKRRRIRTILQEIMYRAAQFIRKARQLILDFGQHCPAFRAFASIQNQLLEAGQSP
jgi:Transposase DDE domain group 1